MTFEHACLKRGATISWIVMAAFAFSVISGCKKLVQVQAPNTSISSADVYSTDASAIAAVTSIYSIISNNGPYSPQPDGMSGLAALSADELTLYSGVTNPVYNLYYVNALNNNDGADFWEQLYPIIYTANAAIEGLNGAAGVTPKVQQQLMGEAKFCRAFCYFYLVNLYGNVPLVLTTNYTVNATLARTSSTVVWQQIIQDLHDAESVLSSNYLDGTLVNTTSARLRPTKWAAAALLARSYLYNGNWTGADSAASVLIENSQFRLNGLDTVFLTLSNEAIWQLQPVTNNGFDTQDALAFALPSTGPDPYQHLAYLNGSLVEAFEPGDLRRSDWVDSVIVNGVTYYFPFKYQNAVQGNQITEYTMVLRLAEQYLIRAEAEAYGAGDGIMGAITDLDTIRNRAGLADYAGGQDQASVLNAIYHERRFELFTEWGHRWLDLKRTGMVDSVMGTGGVCAAKGGTWSTNWQWYPVPLSELQADPNLVQNSGY
jgi:starch-binding outer membrane protein, SusD/RagB family